jgi:hypothetical protein
MCSHSPNKLIGVSSALAAAGVVTCAAALLDVFVPKGSLAGFLTSMALLALVVTGVVIGYTWVCDKCESYFNGSLDRLLRRGKLNRGDAANPRPAMSPRPTEPKVVGDARPAPDAPQPPVSRGRYVSMLHGIVSPEDATKATTARAWRGQ